MKTAAANNNFAKNIVLLSHTHDACGLAENVLHHFGAGFNPLTVSNHQQRNIFVDFMRFLRDPQQGASLIDLITIFGRTSFLNCKSRCKFDQSTGLCPEAII